MSCDLDEATPVGAIYRVGREPDAWELPDWRFATGEPPTFGMRFDDAEGEYRVLYAGSSELACFVETTATYRLDAVLEAALGDIEVDEDDREAGEVPSGHLPSTWPRGRRVGSATTVGVYASVGGLRSMAFLNAHRDLRRLMLTVGVPGLDGAALRLTTPRTLTQRISRIVFDCSGTDDRQQFAGIHYLSKYGDDIRCWAVFEQARTGAAGVEAIDQRPVDEADAALREALQILGIRIWDVDASRSVDP